MEYTDNYKRKMVDLVVNKKKDIQYLSKRYHIDADVIQQWCDEVLSSIANQNALSDTIYDSKGIKTIVNKSGVAYQARISVHINGVHKKIDLGRFAKREDAKEVFDKACALRDQYKNEDLLELFQALKADYSQRTTTGGLQHSMIPAKKEFRSKFGRGISAYVSKSGKMMYYVATTVSGTSIYFGKFTDLDRARCISDKTQELREKYSGEDLIANFNKLKREIKDGSFIYDMPDNKAVSDPGEAVSEAIVNDDARNDILDVPEQKKTDNEIVDSAQLIEPQDENGTSESVTPTLDESTFPDVKTCFVEPSINDAAARVNAAKASSSAETPRAVQDSFINPFKEAITSIFKPSKGTAPDVVQSVKEKDEWISVNDRYPSFEECTKNNGLFVVSDGVHEYIAQFGFGKVIKWKPLSE